MTRYDNDGVSVDISINTDGWVITLMKDSEPVGTLQILTSTDMAVEVEEDTLSHHISYSYDLDDLFTDIKPFLLNFVRYLRDSPEVLSDF